MTRTRLAAAAAACLLVALVAAGPGSSTPTAPATPCRMSQLTLALGPLISEATGQHTLALRLTNRGAITCTLYGYPRIRLYDRTGEIPFDIGHGGDQMVTSNRPTRVLVRPRRAAFVVLNHYRCDRGNRRAAAVVTVGLAASARAQTASITIRDARRKPEYCGKSDPGSTLTVSPFEPTLEAALNH